MITVRKNNINKAIILLNRFTKEDGDLKRSVERRFFTSKSERRRIAASKAKARARKEGQERLKNENIL